MPSRPNPCRLAGTKDAGPRFDASPILPLHRLRHLVANDPRKEDLESLLRERVRQGELGRVPPIQPDPEVLFGRVSFHLQLNPKEPPLGGPLGGSIIANQFILEVFFFYVLDVFNALRRLFGFF